MRTDTLIVIGMIIASPAIAQDAPVPQRPVVTQKITRAPEPNQFYEVDATGAVWIDWRAVETVAASPQRSDNATAVMMLAIRDGKAKSFSERKPGSN
ncbi:hypothetical protein [Tardiphaga sp. 768_D3_N2_1]|uniref:hypothetical protein n=1 Tax=Tardiphaga sp. 768_D3_N2_1 TaxID=3240783 RepID=UPI003F89959D